MNFYKHYIGDFQRDTGHLSLTERGAYLCLMHHYYATEKPLPNDHQALCRIAGALTKPEQAAVMVAMRQFEATDSGLTHKRIEAELEKAGTRADTNRAIAVAREEARRVARMEHESCNESCTIREPNQTPDTRHQKEQEPKQAAFAASSAAADSCPHSEIIAAYHEILPALARVRTWDADRQRLLRTRWREDKARQSIEWWRDYFAYVLSCPFLMGEVKARDGPPFMADLEWLIRPKNFRKVIEGKYENRAA